MELSHRGEDSFGREVGALILSRSDRCSRYMAYSQSVCPLVFSKEFCFILSL